MTRLYRYLIAVFACFAIHTVASAQEENLFCREITTVIYFGNGILTKPYDRVVARIRLENSLAEILPQEEYEKLEFDIAHNATGGAIRDLFESTIQDLQTDVSRFYRILSNLEFMPDWFQEAAASVAANVDETALRNNQDLQTQIASYEANILRGKKVVVVAHSQGNFFANQSYNSIRNDLLGSFGIVSVANPDSFVGGSGPYTTLVEDLVIAAIRATKIAAGQPQLPLLANITNGLTSDPLGHNFLNAYMALGEPSRSKILNDIVNTLDNLTEQPGQIEEGIITVTLTWGAQPDVDLHVFEPNGTHVYYANRFGISGFLDRDDVTSFGPENYFVACDTLETGTYSVGVNYFFGSSSEVANVQIQAGIATQSFSVFLPTARGPSGDSSPIPVADIIVTGTPEQGFQFEIQ